MLNKMSWDKDQIVVLIKAYKNELALMHHYTTLSLWMIRVMEQSIMHC